MHHRDVSIATKRSIEYRSSIFEGSDLESSATRVRVSVIIPAFNAGASIDETLDSVLRQTYRDFEVLVVDDGSDDDTPARVAAFAARDPRVVLLRQQRGGVAAARNLAISRSRGELVAPLDADDLWD